MDASGLRLVICDDDPAARAALRLLAEERGDVVIAETDQANDAVDLIVRFNPDAIILDLALRFGSGSDVIEAVGRMGLDCPIIVFSSFVGWQVSVGPPVVAVIESTDFAALRRALDDLGSRTTAPSQERRSWQGLTPARVRPVGAVADPDPEFYAALSEAHPADTLFVVRPPDPATVTELAGRVRKELRSQDWLLLQPSRLVVLVVGGNPHAAATIRDRLTRLAGDCRVVETLIAAGEAPGDALSRLTHQLV